MPASANFEFMEEHSARLVRLAAFAERYANDDPASAIAKLRTFAEVLAKLVAARQGVYRQERDSFDEVLRRLVYERVLPRGIADIFHTLRKSGNAAVHADQGDRADALACLKYAYQLAIWFHRTYGSEPTFAPGPYRDLPSTPSMEDLLRGEITRLHVAVLSSEVNAAQASELADQEAKRRAELEARIQREADEKSGWLAQLAESEAERIELADRLAAFQREAAASSAGEIRQLAEKGEAAATKLNLGEAETRRLIDEQLAARGWAADTNQVAALCQRLPPREGAQHGNRRMADGERSR